MRTQSTGGFCRSKFASVVVLSSSAFLTTALIAKSAIAQTNSIVVPAGFGYQATEGESWVNVPSAGGSLLAYYSAPAVGLPDGAVISEIAFRPHNSIHGGAKFSFTVALGYPAVGVRPESMPRDRSKIIASGSLKTVAQTLLVDCPAYAPGGGPAPFLVRIKTQPFVFDASRAGLIVQLGATQPFNAIAGYTIDIMKRASDATEAAVTALESRCRGSTDFASLLDVTDTRSWVPGGHGTVELHLFSTSQALLFFGVATDARFPVKLDAAGMPGCWLWTEALIFLPVKLERYVRTYRNSAVLTLPNNPSLTGARFRMQAFEFDLFANARGVTTSSGLDVIVGSAGTRSFAARMMYHIGPNRTETMDSAESAPILRFTY